MTLILVQELSSLIKRTIEAVPYDGPAIPLTEKSSPLTVLTDNVETAK